MARTHGRSDFEETLRSQGDGASADSPKWSGRSDDDRSLY